jgi:hypothetical protein
MLGPNNAIRTEESFVQTVIENGVPTQKVIKGFLESDPNADKENGEFKQRRSNHVVYHKRYAAHDAALAQKRSMGNAPAGVVEIVALKGAEPAEVNEVQMYFFPKWASIKAGVEALPTTVRDTEDHIKARMAAVKNESWDDDKKNKYYSIANDMLRSCAEFARHAAETIRTDEIIVKDGAAKGAAGVIQHSVISEKYLELTNTRRKDDLITGEASAVTELTREMREERKAQAEMQAKSLLLEERKQYTAEIAAGLRERDEEEEIRLGMKKSANIKSVTMPAETPTRDGDTFSVTAPTPEAIQAAIEDGSAEVTYHTPDYNIGDKIQLESGEAEVIGKPFGRAKVRLADGTETMLDKL